MKMDHALPNFQNASPSISPSQVLLGKWVAALCSFEALFLLYIFAGRFKADARFDFIPVDMTALFLCLSAMAGVIACCQRGYRLPKRSPLFLIVSTFFFVYLVSSYLWSCSIEYGWEKFQYIGILTFYAAVVCAVVISSSRNRLVRFAYLLVCFAFWIAIERLVFAQTFDASDTDFQIGGNYLGVGRVVGMATLICLVFGLKSSRTMKHRSLLYLGVGFFSTVLLLVGGRMPCLASLIAAVVFALVDRAKPRKSDNRRRGSVVAMLGISVVAAYLFWSFGSDKSEFRTIRRFEVLFTVDEYGNSGSGRLELWDAAMQLWMERPFFGHGLGSFSILHRNEDTRSYPHNLFLELGVETGLVGVSLLLVLMRVSYRNLASQGKFRDDPLRLLILVLLVNAFCNAMVSGDVPDNRIFFGLLGLTCLIDRKVLSNDENRASHFRALSV